MHQLLVRKTLPSHSQHCPRDRMCHHRNAAEQGTMISDLCGAQKTAQLYGFCEDAISWHSWGGEHCGRGKEGGVALMSKKNQQHQRRWWAGWSQKRQLTGNASHHFGRTITDILCSGHQHLPRHSDQLCFQTLIGNRPQLTAHLSLCWSHPQAAQCRSMYCIPWKR